MVIPAFTPPTVDAWGIKFVHLSSILRRKSHRFYGVVTRDEVPVCLKLVKLVKLVRHDGVDVGRAALPADWGTHGTHNTPLLFKEMQGSRHFARGRVTLKDTF